MRYWVLLILLLPQILCAQMGRKNSLSGQFGLSRGEFVIGADFEHLLLSNVGIGGSFLFAGGSDEEAIPEIMSMNFISKMHVATANNIDFAVGTGFGFSMVELGTYDETAIGPLLSLAAYYQLTPVFSLGADYRTLFNWTEEEFPSNIEYATLSFRFSF